mgnify:CR=1 FL=1
MQAGTSRTISEARETLGQPANLYELEQGVQTRTFRHMDQLYPTRPVLRGSQVYPLQVAEAIAPAYEADGQTHDADAFMRRNDVTGLLVLKGDQIVLEKYAQGNDEHTRWTSFSVAKSLSATLIAAALHEGAIASLQDMVVKYVPELAGSGYDGVTVEQVLIGMSLCMVMRVTLAVVEMTGDICGMQMGLAFATFFSADTSTNSCF